MKISLVTITFNSGVTVKETIESVLRQTYTNIEYIIVDGASTDRTLDIIKQYESQFKDKLKWITEKDDGIYDAMNKGIQMATGDIIGILNSDDIFQDDYVLEDITNSFDDDTDAIFGNLYLVKEKDISSIVRVWKGSPYYNNAFCKGWHPAHPTFYVKKHIYEKFGLFDTSFDVSADFELMLRFIEKNHIFTKYIDRYMVRMRIGGESTGSIKKIIEGNRNIIRAFKKNNISVSVFYPFFRLIPKVINILKYKLKLAEN